VAITRHQYRIYINAPIEQVWAALIDPHFTRRYFHGTAFDSPPQVGQDYRTSMEDGSPAKEGTIEVLDQPHRLVMTERVLYDVAMAAELPSRVEWTLTEAGNGVTQVDLIHGDLARSPLTWAHVKDGWVWILNGLKTLLETGASLPEATIKQPPVSGDPAGDWHRTQGIECNNSVWELIGKSDRTAADNEEMLRRAYASAYHWQRAARRGPENEARALWMLSKVHLLVDNPNEALRYADLCMAQCQQHDLVDFDLAYAYEVQARALQALGATERAAVAWAAALAVPIVDPEDKAIVDADLAVGP
jgi:uncharacterized protein YndB with AHSA1/START domain